MGTSYYSSVTSAIPHKILLYNIICVARRFFDSNIDACGGVEWSKHRRSEVRYGFLTVSLHWDPRNHSPQLMNDAVWFNSFDYYSLPTPCYPTSPHEV